MGIVRIANLKRPYREGGPIEEGGISQTNQIKVKSRLSKEMYLRLDPSKSSSVHQITPENSRPCSDEV